MDPKNPKPLAPTTVDPSLANTQVGAAAETPGPTSQLPRGAMLGRYLVLDRLGSGGMGVVYAAYDPELDRKLAIKLWRTERKSKSSASEGRVRLLREAQAMARLAHPNIIAVHDVGTWEDQVFIAMEFVAGQSLAQWLEGGVRPWREILDVFTQAGRGLAAAHAAGLVHRDFKLDNVLWGNDGRVRVLDFGLARAAGQILEPGGEANLDESSSGNRLSSPLTRTGAIVGTPAYMAPEQLLGLATDPRTDQFSFCVALYEAFYGTRPFSGDTVEQLVAEVGRGNIREPPKDGRIPGWLREILQRGLRIEPKDRFSSMDDLLAALAHDPSVSRRRWLALAAAVGLLGVGLLAGHRMLGRGQTVCRGAESKWMGAWDHSRKEAMRVAFVASGKPYAEDAYRGVERVLDGYAKAWASMYTEACEATRVRGEQSEELLDLRMQCLSLRREETKALADLLMRADAAAVEQAVAAAEALPGLDRCANAVLLRAPLPPPVNAHTHDQVVALRKRLAAAQALKQAGKYTEGLAIASAAAREAKALAYRPLEAEALYQQGDLQERTGDAEAAQATLLSAAVAAEAGRHDALAADSFILLDWTNRQAAHYAEAHGWEQMAFAAIERLGGNDELLGRLLNSVGLTLYEEGKYPESLAAFERALALSERSTTDVASTRVGALLNNLGNVQRALGNDELAEAYHRRDLALTEKALGPMHPDVATALNNLGNVLSDRGENAQAQAQHERALAIQEAALGANHPSISTTLNNLGDVFQNQGQYEKALACHRRALLLLQQAFGPKHPRVAFSLHNMGAVFLDQGRYQTALEYHRRALAIWEDTLGHEHPYVAYALTGIGQALLGLGENAVAPLERALTLRMSQSAQPAELAETRFALARALAASRGDPKRARTLAQQARATYAVAGSRSKKELDEVDTWLQKNP